MRSSTRWIRERARAWFVKTLVVVLGSAAAAAYAKTENTDAQEDPPARVGRLSYVSGPVTLTDLQGQYPEAAIVNWPITSDDRLTTGRLGRAEIRIGSTAIRVDDDSVVDFLRIDDATIQVVVQRGSVALRLRNREKLGEIDLLTPRERIALEDVGRYRIDVDRNNGITSVSTFVGHARVTVDQTSFVVRSGQRGEISGQPPVFHVIAAVPDSFDDWVATRDRRDDASQSARYVSPETTGIESLDEYGEWRTVETYGAVWYPRSVFVGWAPYRYGRWAYIAPWGWTWIDDAPWGFAPFHYGRWVFVGGAWGWAPGVYVARPVYAPALVAWYGYPGTSVSISIGASVGWFPLGPGEVFIPGYRCSRRYINGVNYTHVTNIVNVTVINPPAHYRYRKPDYSTWVPGDTLRRNQPVHRVVQPAPRDWAHRPALPRPNVDAPLAGRRTTMPVPVPRNVVTEQPRPLTPDQATPGRRDAPRPDSPRRAIETPDRTAPDQAAPGRRDTPRPIDSPRRTIETPDRTAPDRAAPPDRRDTVRPIDAPRRTIETPDRAAPDRAPDRRDTARPIDSQRRTIETPDRTAPDQVSGGARGERPRVDSNPRDESPARAPRPPVRDGRVEHPRASPPNASAPPAVMTPPAASAPPAGAPPSSEQRRVAPVERPLPRQYRDAPEPLPRRAPDEQPRVRIVPHAPPPASPQRQVEPAPAAPAVRQAPHRPPPQERESRGDDRRRSAIRESNREPSGRDMGRAVQR
jgi:hypothetical protein